MTILSAICSIIFLFLTVHNINAAIELKAYKKGQHGEVLYAMEEDRLWIKILRILALLLMLFVIGVYIYDVTQVERFSDVDGMRPLSIVFGLALFAFAPFSTSRWVMTGEGVYVYNSASFVPWSQMITTGVQRRKNSTYLVIQIKKEKGEFFKQTFTMLRTRPEDADRLSSMVREFIHALDKLKMLKHIKDEKEEQQKKKKKNLWY